ncbi:MAG: carboxypeptidase-like regulatory domain-containing protein [Planctomycetota bacterium]
MPAFLLPFLLLTLPPAQGVDLRERTFGRIEAQEEQDWAGARVEFFARPLGKPDEISAPERVGVQADAEGRFEARLVPGLLYDAWAVKKVGEGRYLVTAIAKDVVAGEPLSLTALKEPNLEVELELKGQQRWPGRGPFRVEVRASNPQTWIVELEPKQEGRWSLPLLPGTRATVQVETEDGQVLLTHSLDLVAQKREEKRKAMAGWTETYKRSLELEAKKQAEKADKADKADKEEQTEKGDEADEDQDGDGDGDAEKKKKAKKKVVVPQAPFPEYLEDELPPVEVDWLVLPRSFRCRFKIQAGEDKPLAGIEVRQAVRSGKHHDMPPVLARSDDKGMVEVVVPQVYQGYGIPKTSPQMQFLFSGDGYATISEGWFSYQRGEKKPLSDEELVAGVSEPRDVEMVSGFAVKGRVLWDEGKPAKGIGVEVALPQVMIYGPNSYGTSGTITLSLRTDDEGRFKVPGICQYSYNLGIRIWVDGARVRQQLNLPEPVPDAPIEPYGQLQLWGRSDDLELPDFNLAGLRIVCVEVRRADGQVGSNSQVLALANANVDFWNLERSRGSHVVADRRGVAWLLLHPRMCNLFVRSGKDGYFFGGMEIPEGDSGLPLLVRPRLQSFSTVRGRVVDEKGQGVPKASIRVGSTWIMNGNPTTNMIYSMNYRLLSGTTDAQGWFEVPFIPDSNVRFTLRVNGKVGGKNVNSDDQLTVSDSEIRDAVIELPGVLTEEELAKAKAGDKGAGAKKAGSDPVGSIVDGAMGLLQKLKERAAAQQAEKAAAAKKAAAQKAEKDAADKKAADKEAAGKEAAGKEAAGKEAASRPAVSGEEG